MSDILVTWPGNISPVICFHNWRVIPGHKNHMKATNEVTPKRRGGFEGFRRRHALGTEAVSHLSLSLQPQYSLTCHQNWFSNRNLIENRCTYSKKKKSCKLKRLSRKLKLHHVGGDVLHGVRVLRLFVCVALGSRVLSGWRRLTVTYTRRILQSGRRCFDSALAALLILLCLNILRADKARDGWPPPPTSPRTLFSRRSYWGIQSPLPPPSVNQHVAGEPDTTRWNSTPHNNILNKHKLLRD